MKSPNYLIKKQNYSTTTNEIKVGERVVFKDGSGTLACSIDGLENIHPAFERRNAGAKKGVVVATSCVLPTEPFIGSRDFVNDTIVVTDDHMTIFCYHKFLRKI